MFLCQRFADLVAQDLRRQAVGLEHGVGRAAAAEGVVHAMANERRGAVLAQELGNGAAEAAFETGKAYFLGVDSDQELTLSSDLAAITLTSGLKNIGNSLIWFFDEMDAGRTYFGQEVSLGLAEGGVGIVTDKNFATFANDDLKAAITAAEEAIKAGEVTVDSALAEGGPDLAVQLKNEVQP